MSLVDVVVDAAAEIANAGRLRIAACAAYGVSCEGWLKIELLNALSSAMDDSVQLLIESDDVDLTLKSPSELLLVELKTFPTNYGRAGKPITKFVASVVADLSKLTRKKPASAIGLAIWMAYVVPEPIPPTWPHHLAKIEAVALRTVRAERILLWDKAFAHLYVMETH